MITSASNTQVKHYTAESENKSPQRAGVICSRRTENVRGGSQGLDF